MSLRSLLVNLGWLLFYAGIIAGVYMLVKSCSNADEAKDEMPAKPCYIDTTNIAWYSKDATITEFTISTAKELMEFAELVNCGNGFYGKTVMLGANIMLNDTANWRNWKNKPPKNEWKPIDIFGGTFYGKGYVIAGVYINSLDNKQGLFKIITGTLKNIGVVASYIKGKNFVGGLAGRNNGIISDGYFRGTVIGENKVGGLVGGNGGKIVNSHFIGDVTGSGNVGGLMGGSAKKIINSYSKGTITVYHDVSEEDD